MTRTWPTSGFEKRPLANSLDTAYPRTEGMEKPYLNPDVVALIQRMFASEADSVISNIWGISIPEVQAITVKTITKYYWAFAANDDNVPKSINGLRIAA